LGLTHLGYRYIYEGAQSEAIKGGTVSEALIGSFPHFNPLLPSSDHNDYINRLLYRSLLEYSLENSQLEKSIVSCDLEDLLSIQCTLENNIKWSDGSDLTTEDIRMTFDMIKQTKVNPILASLLESTTIETTPDTIQFSREKRDISFLQVFLQPILPSSLLQTLNTENVDGKFSEIGALYSGRFRLVNINQDETVGVTKLTL
jgi:ABC-type transport system substrate-binding protein